MGASDIAGGIVGALCLTAPLWGAYLLRAWLDSRPTPAQRYARNHANVLRRRAQIDRNAH